MSARTCRCPEGAEVTPVDLDEARSLLDQAGVDYLVDVADPGGYLLSDWTCGTAGIEDTDGRTRRTPGSLPRKSARAVQ